MKNKKKHMLNIDDNYFISIKKKSSNTINLIGSILNVLLVILINIPFVRMLNKGFKLELNYTLIIIICAIIYSIYYFTIIKNNIKWMRFIFIAFLIVSIFILKDYFASGFINVYNSIILEINDYYATNYNQLINNNAFLSFSDSNMIFITYIIIIFGIFGIEAENTFHKITIYIITGLVPFALLLAVGIIPDGLSIFIYTNAIIIMLITTNTYDMGRMILGVSKYKAIIVMCFLNALLFIGLQQINPLYKKNQYIENLKTNVNQYIKEVKEDKFWDTAFGGFFSEKKKTRTGEKIKLGQTDSLNLTNRTVLKLTMNITRNPDIEIEDYTNDPNNLETTFPMYLKGFIGDIYENNTWYGKTEEEKEEFSNEFKNISIINREYMSLTSNASYITTNAINEGTLKIKNIDSDNKTRYIPYYSMINKSKGLDWKLDSESSEYNCDFINIYEDENKDKQFRIDDFLYSMALSDYSTEKYKKYDDYVKERYTQLPSEDEMPLLYKYLENKDGKENHYFEKNKYNMQSVETKSQKDVLMQYIKYVKNYLSDYAYTLAPGKTSSGKDFIEDFLLNKKEGYCVYFASAATFLFRYLGVPARYVEGYIVEKNDWEKVGAHDNSYMGIEGSKYIVDVPEKRGHAWTEVYLEGFGWIPVEVTGTSNIIEEETTTTKATTTTTQKKNKTTKASTTNKNSQDETTKLNESNNNFFIQNKNFIIILFAVFIVLLTLAIYILHIKRKMSYKRKIIKKKEKKYLNKKLKILVLYLKAINVDTWELENGIFKEKNILEKTNISELEKIQLQNNIKCILEIMNLYYFSDKFMLDKEYKDSLEGNMNKIIKIINKNIGIKRIIYFVIAKLL